MARCENVKMKKKLEVEVEIEVDDEVGGELECNPKVRVLEQQRSLPLAIESLYRLGSSGFDERDCEISRLATTIPILHLPGVPLLILV